MVIKQLLFIFMEYINAMATYTYPAAPAGVPDEVTQPSAGFRNEVRKVVLTLVLFGLLYLLILAASIALTIMLVMMGFWIVAAIHNIWAIIFGIGIAGVGLMVLAFVIKFLFARKVETDSRRREITAEEYPDLFDFIRNISEETHTRFPKHIYLSPEVNAYVFYDSSFWSMILPVRKNLVVGLGLVNMTNLSEFKSVIAHEFGHFSQKSMRAGSYVYHANKVLYNMLYENNSYSEALSRWAGIHTIFSICAQITVKIVQVIQWILQQAYKVVNKQYMSLSRQMEFHADAMSAKVAGSNNAVHALRRIEFADVCYQTVIERYNEWLPDKFKGQNLFTHQRIAGAVIAADYRLPLSGGLPLLQEADQHYKAYNRVKLGDQWASHPSREQREEALNALNLHGPVVDEPAWILFPDAGALQETFTSQLYEQVPDRDDLVTLNDEQFSQKHAAKISSYSYPVYYEGFYNGRSISRFDTHGHSMLTRTITDLPAFFQADNDLYKKIQAMQNDLELLDYIADRNNAVRSFDFEGDRYKRRDVPTLKARVETQLKEAEQSLVKKDEQVYAHFFHIAQLQSKGTADALRQAYETAFKFEDIKADNLKSCEHVVALMQPFNSDQTAENARYHSEQLKEAVLLLNTRMKRIHDELAAMPEFADYAMPDTVLSVNKTHLAFVTSAGRFNVAHLEEVWEYVQQVRIWTYETSFRIQKNLLEKQLIIAGLPVTDMVSVG